MLVVPDVITIKLRCAAPPELSFYVDLKATNMTLLGSCLEIGLC